MNTNLNTKQHLESSSKSKLIQSKISYLFSRLAQMCYQVLNRVHCRNNMFSMARLQLNKYKISRSLIFTIIFSIILSSMIIIDMPAIVHAEQPFNIEIELPSTYQEVEASNRIWFTVKLLNLANSKRVDVTLNYAISDSSNNSIVHNSKTVAIETQASFVADLTLPSDIKPGDYNLNVIVNSTMGESYAKTTFKVVAPKKAIIMQYTYYAAYAAAGIFVIILIIVLIVKSKPLRERMKLRSRIKKIVRDKLKEN